MSGFGLARVKHRIYHRETIIFAVMCGSVLVCGLCQARRAIDRSSRSGKKSLDTNYSTNIIEYIGPSLPHRMPDINMSSSMQDPSSKPSPRKRHRGPTPSFSFLHCVVLLWTAQWCVTATTVPPLTAKAGRAYKQQYGDASLEGSKWKLLRLVRVLK